jgi:D-alanyl-D-alanine carboxypeptidase
LQRPTGSRCACCSTAQAGFPSTKTRSSTARSARTRTGSGGSRSFSSWRRHRRQFEPGEQYACSNTDYTLLGLVIEEATGEPWRAAVRERVIDRLDLESTSLPEPGDVSLRDNAAHGYELVDGELRDFSDVDPSMAGAAGGHALLTTTEDLAHFMDALLAGELFEQPETFDEMLTLVPAADVPGKVGYGLGIERYELPGGVEMIGHLGTTAGYRAFVGRLLAQQIDIAMVITNQDDPTPVLMPALELMVAEAA